MRQHIGLIRKDARSDFAVSFPDFPGAVTAGKDLDDARAMAEEAMSLHVDGLTPTAKPFPSRRLLKKR